MFPIKGEGRRLIDVIPTKTPPGVEQAPRPASARIPSGVIPTKTPPGVEQYSAMIGFCSAVHCDPDQDASGR